MKQYIRILTLIVTTSLVVACSLSGEQSNSAFQDKGKICPDWSSSSTTNYDNEDFSNQGCAFRNNMYVQLKDPEDYRRGSGKSGITGARDSNILQNYYNGTSSSAASSGTSATAGGSASSR